MKTILSHKILDKIISLQNYCKADYPTTYISELKYNNQDIIEIGVEHSRNPKHKNYILINSFFKKFVEAHDPKKSVILIENFIQKEILSQEEMISRLGESGFLLWLADKHKIHAVCPEPSQEEILTLANQHFGHTEEILLWIFVNLLSNLSNDNKIISQKSLDIIMRQITAAGETIKLKKTNTEYLKNFGRLLAKLTNNKISFSNEANLISSNIDTKTLNDIQSPLLKKSILNDVSAAINIARDAHILSNKINLLKKGYNIFSVFGKNHTVCQEMALGEFIKLKEL